MGNIELRPYQQQAINKIVWAQKLEGNDLCVLPTGAGKSIVIANLAHKIDKNILILQPTKEILEQNYQKLLKYMPPDQIGIFSASVGRKDIAKITLATIQSIYTLPHLFADFSLVILDECHLLNHKNQDGMLTGFLKNIGSPKVIGLTATPYRLATRYDHSNYYPEIVTVTKLINRMAPLFWHRMMYCMNIGELLEMGYLSPLEYVDLSLVDHKQIPLNATRSDFDLDAFVEMVGEQWKKILNIVEIAKSGNQHVLVFCATVGQAEQLSKEIVGSAVVSAKTPKKQREAIVEGFKKGDIQIVFNVGVLTTGFDFPELDCIVMIRPTRSLALYYQMLGRGVRKAENKKNCVVYDLTSNVKHMGRVETIRLEKQEKWELITETGSWHDKELYRFTVLQ